MQQQTEQLRKAVNQLHSALASTSELDAEARGLLEEALTDVLQFLKRSGSAGAADSELALAVPSSQTRNRLSEAALNFEGTHPTLAGTVQSVIDALAQMGI